MNDELLEYYIDYKILGCLMKEYNVLIDFFKAREDNEIIELLNKRRDEYHKQIKTRGEQYLLDTSPKRKITQREYDELVELAHKLITGEKKGTPDLFLDIQQELDKKRIE
ncbi:MAG: hypothetical protein GF317_07935 [Candidatus Lokiarchaeota archaeon]|nr:hypothetical protein [Candidatus Lokiarchaeota archaeon]MBD3199642.1 hypothetical protein [Candidatus Lokiarchaeota archaeon]